MNPMKNVGFIWFSFVGGTTMSLEFNDIINLSALTDEEMLIGMLSTMPVSTLSSIVSIILIAVFSLLQQTLPPSF